MLGLRTFITTGPQETSLDVSCRLVNAPECAGKIHSDLQRGFIRAETIAWDELLAAGSLAKAKELGKVRSEGKDYIVQDGDVLEIRFNVGRVRRWMARDGVVLASLEVPQGRKAPLRAARKARASEAMLIEHTRSVHSFRMRFSLDIAVLDADGVVLKTLTLHPNRLTAPMIHARSILEAEAGAFGSWELKIGDRLDFSE
ncbi:MAG: DUF933 domain-containing protein [Acidimicrobiales bacterium]